MIRTILKSDKNSLTLQLPDDLVGKTIEVIAFSIEDAKEKTTSPVSKKNSTADLKDKLADFTFNSGGYKFDRNDANNYE